MCRPMPVGTAAFPGVIKNSMKGSIAYYITSHGYGHGSRSCDIIRAINHLYPQVTVHIVTQLAESFLSNQIGNNVNGIRARSFDVGMVQIDSIRVDVDATLTLVEQGCAARRERIAEECSFLKERKIDLVVVDIPAIPLDAAAQMGIPSVAIGNFSWDWIYSGFLSRDPRWKPIVDIFREAYAKTDLLLRMPFCDSMDAFPRIEDIPLVATPGNCRREKIAQTTGCNPDAKWILLSFTTLEWNEEALARIEEFEGYEFFTVRPLHWERGNIHALDREWVTFSDVMASVDAVISKPGFGILSDCIVNRKPLIYAERSDFLEYPILESALRKYLRHVHIPAEDLYRGNLGASLARIWESPDAESSLARGGDIMAAQRIAQFL